jgi:hypothetical protein
LIEQDFSRKTGDHFSEILLSLGDANYFEPKDELCVGA